VASPRPGASLNGAPTTNGSHDDLEIERVRLEAELSATRARIAAAKQRLASRDAQVEAAMRRELAVTRETIAAMEREHQEALAALRQGVAQGPSAGGAG
jgi:chromosome segregation ATPase